MDIKLITRETDHEITVLDSNSEKIKIIVTKRSFKKCLKSIKENEPYYAQCKYKVNEKFVNGRIGMCIDNRRLYLLITSSCYKIIADIEADFALRNINDLKSKCYTSHAELKAC